MKTAMQELFIQLEMEHPNLFNTNTLEGRKFINDYYKFFEMEKKQIKYSYLNGQFNGIEYKGTGTSEDYYNDEFKTNDN